MLKGTKYVTAAILLLAALPVLAQTVDTVSDPTAVQVRHGMSGGGMDFMGGPGMMGGSACPMMGMGHGEMALDQCLMMHVQALGLTEDQMRRLYTVITDYQKEKINLSSQIEIKEIDLHTLLMADNVDMRKVETQVRDINKLQGDLQLAGIRAFEAGKNVLTPEQRQMLRRVMMGCRGACPMMGGMGAGEMGAMSCPMMGGMVGGMSGTQGAAVPPASGH